MELEVTVTNPSLDAIVAVAVDHLEETITTTTLGDVIVQALLARLAADPRWDRLAERFWDVVDEHLAAAAPGFAEDLVRQEVARQLADRAQGAVTRGQRSTRAEAIVATEVTAQLRAQFSPVVEAALADLRGQLGAAASEAVAAFREKLGRG
jgi:hypothetical protein